MISLLLHLLSVSLVWGGSVAFSEKLSTAITGEQVVFNYELTHVGDERVQDAEFYIKLQDQEVFLGAQKSIAPNDIIKLSKKITSDFFIKKGAYHVLVEVRWKDSNFYQFYTTSVHEVFSSKVEPFHPLEFVPASIEVESEPGTEKYEFKVVNRSPEKVTFNIGVYAAYGSEIKIPVTQLSLEAGETQLVPFTVSIATPRPNPFLSFFYLTGKRGSERWSQIFNTTVRCAALRVEMPVLFTERIAFIGLGVSIVGLLLVGLLDFLKRRRSSF